VSNEWLTAGLPSIEEIQSRLRDIFPREIDVNGYIIREIGAKTVFTMLYGFCVNGGNWIRPAAITCMTDEQAAIQDPESRKQWLRIIQSPSAPRDIPDRWYKPNTREPIRDETLRDMVRFNAVLERSELPTTSPSPRYTLQDKFAELFNPELKGEVLANAISEWQDKFLSAPALARVALSKHLATSQSDGVLVNLPNGETRKLASGPSSELAKAVIEQFTKNFMKVPAVVLISESARKLILKDDKLCRAIGFSIDVSGVLPDIILADLDENHPIIIFVECVASDGPVNDRRKQELEVMESAASYHEKDFAYLTVFKDRSDAASRRLLPSIAWGTFVWYASEPDEIMFLREGGPERRTSIGEMLEI
jgi:hypothetical protein